MPIQTVEAVYEGGVFKPLNSIDLPEGRNVILSVQPRPLTPEEIDAHLAKWHALYEGLTEEQIDELEKIILDRRDPPRDPKDI